MHSEQRKSSNRRGGRVSRRTFLGLGAGTLAGWLAACQGRSEPEETEPTSPSPSPPPPTAAATPVLPTPTSVPPTATSPPSASPEPRDATSEPTAPVKDRAALMAHYPASATSRVVVVRHSGVWVGDEPAMDTVLAMLDAGLSGLTGTEDPLAIWQALFDPSERVLLKVNCIASGGPTQPAVAYAVAQRLQDAGLTPENILIFDRTDNELAYAGYTLNDGGPGVQCRGKRDLGSDAVLTQATVKFYREFDEVDALINIPTPKQHGGAGVSVSMKNHYGSVNRPGSLHGNWCDPAIAELNSQPNIRDKTRLIVGAALNVSPFDWERPEQENALLLSFDPVALDTVARDILVRHREANGSNAGYLMQGSIHLGTAQSLGLGTTDPDLIDLQELILG